MDIDASNTKNIDDRGKAIVCNEENNGTENSKIPFDKKESRTNSSATDRKLRVRKNTNYKI